MKKKGQAAMEFLMTYGWAILVVIAAIAALAYFGVLDPARLLPERCQFPAGMDCIDKAAITTDTVTIALRNNIGFGITVDSATDGDTLCGGALVDIDDGNGFVAIANNAVPNNGVFRIRLNTCDIATDAKLDTTITVGYTNSESGLSNNAVGDVRGRIAAP